jgi:hypothetical protein
MRPSAFLAELLASLRENPRRNNFAGAGNGSLVLTEPVPVLPAFQQ